MPLSKMAKGPNGEFVIQILAILSMNKCLDASTNLFPFLDVWTFLDKFLVKIVFPK